MLAVGWALSTIPALKYWQESLVFIIIASIYANVSGEWGAAEAAEAKEELERQNGRSK